MDRINRIYRIREDLEPSVCDFSLAQVKVLGTDEDSLRSIIVPLLDLVILRRGNSILVPHKIPAENSR